MTQGRIMTVNINPKEPAELSASLYHAHHQSHLEDIPFWMEMAAFHGDPILELGCGTGRTLVPLALKGYRVYGLDINFRMLEALKQNQLSSSIGRLNIFQADASAFRLAVQFSLVFMTCNTFSTFGEKKRRAILKSVSKLLSPGGAFVASVPNPIILENLSPRGEDELDDIIQHPITGNPVQVINSWERKDRVFKINWHYDHLLPDGTVDRVTIKINHHIVRADVYRAEILSAGMSLSCVLGDYDLSDYRSDSTYLILKATKD
jgi:SAM-dependent methyltransferase